MLKVCAGGEKKFHESKLQKFIFALILLYLASEISADIYAVESQTLHPNLSNISQYSGIAQSFPVTNGYSHIAGVAICTYAYGSYGPGSLTVSISNSPSSMVLPLTEVTLTNPSPDGFVLFPFTTPVILNSNSTYYIHLSSNNPSYQFCYSAVNPYSSGNLFINTSNENPISMADWDLSFQTIVTLPFIESPPLSASKVLANETWRYSILVEAHPSVGVSSLIKSISTLDTIIASSSISTTFESVYGISARINISILPLASSKGSVASITLSVSNPSNASVAPGEQYVSTFQLLVLGLDGGPVMTDFSLYDPLIVPSSSTDIEPLFFAAADLDSADSELIVSLTSSNPTVVNVSAEHNLFQCDADKSECLLRLERKVFDPLGKSIITVTVTDHWGRKESKWFTVVVDDLPEISKLMDQVIYDNVATLSPQHFSVTDLSNGGESIQITVDSSDIDVIPTLNVTCNTDKSDCYLHLSRIPGVSKIGQSLITISATDPVGGESRVTIIVAVIPSSDPVYGGACCSNGQCSMTITKSQCDNIEGSWSDSATCDQIICIVATSTSAVGGLHDNVGHDDHKNRDVGIAIGVIGSVCCIGTVIAIGSAISVYVYWRRRVPAKHAQRLHDEV